MAKNKKKDNGQRKTKTFSIPPDEITEIEKILEFCNDHGINYSGIIRRGLRKWYETNKESIVQNLFYKPNTSP